MFREPKPAQKKTKTEILRPMQWLFVDLHGTSEQPLN